MLPFSSPRAPHAVCLGPIFISYTSVSSVSGCFYLFCECYLSKRANAHPAPPLLTILATDVPPLAPALYAAPEHHSPPKRLSRAAVMALWLMPPPSAISKKVVARPSRSKPVFAPVSPPPPPRLPLPPPCRSLCMLLSLRRQPLRARGC